MMKDLLINKLMYLAVSASELGIPDGSPDVLKNALNLAYFWAGVVAVIVVVVGGLFYTLSAGNEQSVARAKKAIMGAIVGLMVILLAFSITNVVIGVF